MKDGKVTLALQGLINRAQALQKGQQPVVQPPVAGTPTAPGPSRLAPAVSRGAPGNDGTVGVGLVVDGGALVLLLQPQHEDMFLELAKLCDAVICCRVSPMQKAQVS